MGDLGWDSLFRGGVSGPECVNRVVSWDSIAYRRTWEKRKPEGAPEIVLRKAYHKLINTLKKAL